MFYCLTKFERFYVGNIKDTVIIASSRLKFLKKDKLRLRRLCFTLQELNIIDMNTQEPCFPGIFEHVKA